MKKLFFLLSLISGIAATAQNTPTLLSYTLDTLCEGDYNELFLTVVIEDLDGDSTYLDLFNSSNGYLDDLQGYTAIGGTYTQGGTTRTFEIFGSTAIGSPVGVNLETLNFDIIGNTTNDGGAGFGSVTDVPIYGPIAAQWTTTDLYYCANANPDDLFQYVVQPGGYFNWYDSLGSHSTNVFDPEAGYPEWVQSGGEYYIDYYITNSAGCQGSEWVTLNYYTVPDVSVAITPSTCQSADGSAIATITSGSAPFDVYWTTGLNEQVSTTSSVANLSSGVYYINIEDINGCKNVGKADVYDSDISVTPTITPQYCAGQTGQVDLSINPQSGTVDEIFWSNGATTATLNAPAGEYSVEIHTSTNCNYMGTYVIPDSSLRIVVDGYGGNNNCMTTPDGYVNVSTFGGQGAYTWDWTQNQSPFATSEDISGIPGAWYECTVQDGNGCSLNWGKMIENYSNVYVWANSVTSATCGNADGAIDVSLDTISGDVPSFYEWNTGATTEDISGLAAGAYTLTYTDQSGCQSKLRIDIPNELPYQPEICMLTVDTSYTYNQIVWEKVAGFNVDGFNIYRETSTFGVFEQVQSQPYATESFFVDNAASPIDRSWRYYITTYDACGNESYPSFIHKTIHIVSSDAGGGLFNVSWDKYEGLDYTDVDLFRFTESTGWMNIGTFGLTQLSTVDSPPNTVGLDYIVSFNLSNACTSTKAQDYNSSRSNTTSSTWSPGEDITAIEDLELGTINIYPNPTEGQFTIYIENPAEFERVEIRNVNGQLILSDQIIGNYAEYNLGNLSNGMYFISFVANDKVINEKIIKK